MTCLCLGPVASGKTLLLKRLQSTDVDDTTSTVETIGTNIMAIPRKGPSSTFEKDKKKKHWEERETISIREVGGSMAALWASWYGPMKPIMYVIDSSNLFQVSISTVLLMEMLTHEKLIGSKILVVLSKNDLTNRKRLNYLKFMMRLDNIVNEAGSRVSVEEASSLTGHGIENIRKWINTTCIAHVGGAQTV